MQQVSLTVRDLIVVIFLSLLVLSPPALADDLTSVPLFTRNNSPIIQIFGLPPTEGGQLTTSGDTRARLVLDVANSFTEDNSKDESLRFDGETSRLTFSLRRGFREHWEAGVDIPVISHNGGMLDGLIENWHRAFGLPQSGRDDAPRNRLHYYYADRDSDDGIDFSNSGTGIGDTTLYLARRLTPDSSASRRYLALRGGIKLPTGNSDQLRGSGATDFHLRLAASDGETLKNLDLTLFASVGALWLGHGEILADKQQRTVGFGSFGLGWSALKRVTVKVQIDAHTNFFSDSQLKQIDSPSAQLAFGGTVKVSESLAVDLCIQEDIVVETAPDVTFQMALTYLY